MLFRKFDIHIYRPDGGLSPFCVLRGWHFAILPLLLLFAACLWLWLWPYKQKYAELASLKKARLALLTEQKSEIFRLSDEFEHLARESGRIASFNAKLSIMTSDKPGGGREASSWAKDYSAGIKDNLGLYLPQALVRRMHRLAAYLGRESLSQEVLQQELALVLREKWSRLAAMPSIWPTSGVLGSGFGDRHGHFHKGVDINTHIGTPVSATADGVVSFVGWDGAYGNMVIIDHKYGLQTAYAHLQSANVAEGQKISRGELIAHSGNSGRTTGPHLHYEVRVGASPVDPVNYMLD